MTVSVKRRIDDKTAVLQRMLAELGDRAAGHVHFGQEDEWFNAVLPTTWRELLDDHLIDDHFSSMGASRFRLTAHGWLRGVASSALVDEPDFRERCARLAAALKAVVKGRPSHHDSYADPTTVATEIGVEEGWVMNAVQSKLLSVVFPNSRWDATYKEGLIRVSPTFGLSHGKEE